MDVYITKLRKLLKAEPNIEIINIHGKGYKLIVPTEETGASGKLRELYRSIPKKPLLKERLFCFRPTLYVSKNHIFLKRIIG
jgi:DNA-binding winged helix-turn-helix (wHTH) protein